MMDHRPIVVLDSGLGGLTVVRTLQTALPGEDIVYFGDTARLPYGSKTPSTVTAFVKQIIAYLEPRRPKHVVVACNTATALALPALRLAFPKLTISGVVEPGAKAAVVAAGSKMVPVIGILATEATVRSQAYELAVHRRRHHARLLLRPAPLLVPIIEEGREADDPVVRMALKQYLRPLMKHHIDVLVLGCTHYPVFKDLIAEMVGPHVRVIDSAEQCADDVARRLGTASKRRRPDSEPVLSLAQAEPRVGSARTGSLECFVTDDPARFQRLAPRFLGAPIALPQWVSPDELPAMTPRDLSEVA